MYTAMESWTDGYRKYQRALRIKPFRTLESAVWYAQRHSKRPFVCKGVQVVWCP